MIDEGTRDVGWHEVGKKGFQTDFDMIDLLRTE